MKTLHTKIIAAFCGLMIGIIVSGCSFLAPRLPNGYPATQPTTLPLSPSPAQQAAVTIQSVSAGLPIPWNALGGLLGSVLGLASALYAQTKTGQSVPVAIGKSSAP